ncbi:MAG: S-layer homology domain-containing protein [Firmicutes bacterium]|nr:S-layer homology domain-containing protein [Bacillota bacterium]
MTGMPLATQPVAVLASSPPALRDIKGHWAEADIRAMVTRGVVGGYPGGTFRSVYLAHREGDRGTVFKVDPTGRLLWKKEFDHPAVGLALPGGGCVALLDDRLCRLDADGSVTWIRVYEGLSACALTEVHGGFAFATLGCSDTRCPAVVKTDDSGSVNPVP